MLNYDYTSTFSLQSLLFSSRNIIVSLTKWLYLRNYSSFILSFASISSSFSLASKPIYFSFFTLSSLIYLSSNSYRWHFAYSSYLIFIKGKFYVRWQLLNSFSVINSSPTTPKENFNSFRLILRLVREGLSTLEFFKLGALSWNFMNYSLIYFN